MKIIGCGVIKTVADLKLGELCALWARDGVTLGICIEKDERFTSIGLISGGDFSGKIVKPGSRSSCYSYGDSWVVDVSMSGIKAPLPLKDGPAPRLIIDSGSLKMIFIGGQFDDSHFFDLKDHTLSDRWPDTAVEFDYFQIWQDEASITRDGALALFTKNKS